MIPFIDVHTHTTRNPFSIYNLKSGDLVNNNWQSYGLHPWYITEENVTESNNLLAQLATGNKIIAVGEIGLDRAIMTNFEQQFKVFINQHNIAQQYGLPVIIHCVKAYSDFLSIYKSEQPSVPWIFHGFAGNIDIAEKLILKNCYLSFGEKLLENQNLQYILTKVSLKNVFFETDESLERIESIYQKAAEVLQIDLELLKSTIYSNFNTVFNNK